MGLLRAWGRSCRVKGRRLAQGSRLVDQWRGRPVAPESSPHGRGLARDQPRTQAGLGEPKSRPLMVGVHDPPGCSRRAPRSSAGELGLRLTASRPRTSPSSRPQRRRSLASRSRVAPSVRPCQHCAIMPLTWAFAANLPQENGTPTLKKWNLRPPRKTSSQTPRSEHV